MYYVSFKIVSSVWSSPVYYLCCALAEGEQTVEMTPTNEEDVGAETKPTDEATSPLRGDRAEGKKKKKKKKSVLTVLFDPFIVLCTGWRTYARQRVVFAGLALSMLYMTVLGFDSTTTGECHQQVSPQVSVTTGGNK